MYRIEVRDNKKWKFKTQLKIFSHAKKKAADLFLELGKDTRLLIGKKVIIVNIVEKNKIRKDMSMIDRRKKAGFMYYMKNNPYYFKEVFGDIPLESAWIQAKTLTLDQPSEGGEEYGRNPRYFKE